MIKKDIKKEIQSLVKNSKLNDQEKKMWTAYLEFVEESDFEKLHDALVTDINGMTEFLKNNIKERLAA